MKPAMSPKVLTQMMQMGIVQSFSSQCNHREGLLPELAVRCPQPGVVICGGCGRASCTDPRHVYLRFMTTRGVFSYLETGTKFYYRCERCWNFLCIYCLGIEDD